MGCERALLAHSTLKPFLIYCVCLVNSFYFSFPPPLLPELGRGSLCHLEDAFLCS